MKIKARTMIGGVITAIWLAGLGYIFNEKGGVEALFKLPLNEIGDFLAGAFAPLAFIWFVIAYAQQGEELRQNTAALSAQYEEMKKTAEQAAIQAEAIKANELHARRDLFLRYADLMVSGIQFKSLLLLIAAKKSKWGERYSSAIQKSHDAYFAGDKDAPIRRLIEVIQLAPDEFRTGAMTIKDFPKLIERLLNDYRSLLKEAHIADGGGTSLAGFYEHSLCGDLYTAICFICMQDTGFSVRARITGLDEILI
jgi:hypothetical protein